jgi:hypothetical protein
VLHLSGHAAITVEGPRFVMEDDIGRREDASAADIADAVGHRWPPLVFLSGCRTGGASDEGDVASMAEALVIAGAPSVLGWALPVGDHAASRLAAELYRGLAGGSGRDRAVANARRLLFVEANRFWHLLRLYADRSPLGPLVTAPAAPGRSKLRVRPVAELFLDPTGEVKVASREGFVGRRRELQRCLAALRPSDPGTGPPVLVLHGMGGLGKSTLAARLLDRLRHSHAHQAVWVGKVDDLEVGKLTQRINVDSDTHQRVNELLSKPGIPLVDRLVFVLDGPLADTPCVFVFDDFERGNLDDDGQGGHVCTPEALDVVTAFAAAIARTASPSRVIVTSRHDFPLPTRVRAVRESLLELSGTDLDKKLRLTQHLGPTSTIDPAVRDRAIAAASGIPRLIERLDRVVADPQIDVAALLDAITETTVEYREEILAERLLSAQRPEVRQVLGLASVYEIPVPEPAIMALDPSQSVAGPLARAVAVGLIESGVHPGTGGTRYLVSNLLKPLIEGCPEQLTADDRTTAVARAARALYRLWVGSRGE